MTLFFSKTVNGKKFIFRDGKWVNNKGNTLNRSAQYQRRSKSVITAAWLAYYYDASCLTWYKIIVIRSFIGDVCTQKWLIGSLASNYMVSLCESWIPMRKKCFMGINASSQRLQGIKVSMNVCASACLLLSNQMFSLIDHFPDTHQVSLRFTPHPP